jgi:predicted nucleic acid-binding protein
VIYTDSSVALAHLFRERQRPADSFWKQPLVSSKLLEYEVWNRVHTYRLTTSHSNEARQLLARVVLIELGEPVLSRALEPFPVAVRTLDALHLATMNFISSGGESAELASYDHRLLAAAEALGIPPAAL